MSKKIVLLCVCAVLLTVLGACAAKPAASSHQEPSSAVSATVAPESELTESADSRSQITSAVPSETPVSNIAESANLSESNILIAYYSWSGNTRQLAGEIQTQTGGDLFEIMPETPYTEDINELSGISLQEQRDHVRPALSTHVEDMAQYDIVFIGYPNWWNDAPMPVFTFLEEYDFSGKKVIPFSTYGNGGFGKSIQSIESIVSGSTVLEGLAIQEHELDSAPDTVSEWLQSLSLEP